MKFEEFTVKLKGLKGVFISKTGNALTITAPDCGYAATYYDHELDHLEYIYNAVVEDITARHNIIANYVTSARS